jgi:hypothetical protein
MTIVPLRADLFPQEAGLLDACQTCECKSREVRMLPLRIERTAERDTTPREDFLERAEGALLLTSFAVATIGWCCLLALVSWKALFWLLESAG